jgi:hypothetical protein
VATSRAPTRSGHSRLRGAIRNARFVDRKAIVEIGYSLLKLVLLWKNRKTVCVVLGGELGEVDPELAGTVKTLCVVACAGWHR